MRDAVGSQNLIPGHKSYILRIRRIYDLCSDVTPRSCNCASYCCSRLSQKHITSCRYLSIGTCPTTVVPLYTRYRERIVVVAYITPTVQHFSNKTGPNILVNMISSNNRIYGKGFYCRNEFRSHCMHVCLQ